MGAFKRSAPIAGTISVVGGVIADVLTPLAAMAPWLFWVFLSATCVVGYIWFGRKRKPLLEELSRRNLSAVEISEEMQSNRWCKSFGFLSVTSLVMSFVLLMQMLFASDDKGALALVSRL